MLIMPWFKDNSCYGSQMVTLLCTQAKDCMLREYYINRRLRLSSDHHSRRTWGAHLSFIMPCNLRDREAGRSFPVTASKLWNNLPLKYRISVQLMFLKKVCINNFYSFQAQFPSFQNCSVQLFYYLLDIRIYAYHCLQFLVFSCIHNCK